MSVRQAALSALLLLLVACSAEAPAPVGPASPPPTASASIDVPIQAPARAGPPVAPVRPVSDTYFGVTVTDPYRWMEQDSPERAAWLKGQSDFTRGALDALPQRAALLARIHELGEGGEEVSRVYPAGGRVFYLKRGHGQEQARLCVRDLAAGSPERALVDPAAEGHFSIDDHWPSLDGKLVAYKTSPAGTEVGVLRVMDVATGKLLPDAIDRLGFSDVVWLDGKSFLYGRLRKLPAGSPQSERFKKIVTFAHTLGRDPETDPTVFGPGWRGRGRARAACPSRRP